MRNPWIGRSVGAAAVVVGLLAAPAAQAQTFVASPSIPDTTATSACTTPCALRQAIAAAEAAEEAAVNGFKTETQTIELPVGTYTLTNGPLRIKHKYGGEPEGLTLTLQGLGARADEVVITAAGKSRVLVDGDFGGTSGAVVLKRLELTGGNGEGGIEPEEPLEPEKGEGGAVAIEQNGTLELDEVLVTGNTAASAGGGVEDDGELAAQDSTIAHNTVTGGLGLGGGLSSENPNSFSHELVTVVNSTIADNSVSGGSTNEGGAIYAGSILKLTNSTLSGNSAPGSGGTLATGGEATSTIANSIIAYDKGRACAGTNPTSLGGNDVADVGCELANQKKTNDISADPGLEKESAEAPKLADNGGPTETIAIADALSPPVKNGLEQYCPASDQRGAERPAGNNCSAGAYQYGAKPGAIISASVTPNGAGVVSAKSAIAEAECSAAQCTVPAQASGKVSFSEVPSSGFGFAEWIGCPKVISGECEVENDGANQSVTAKFLARFAVTAATATQETKVSATASGAAAVCAATSCTVDEGEAATLTAESSDPGLQFVGWSGGSCATQNPCKLEHVKGTETDTASFELGPPSSPPAGTAYAYFNAEAPSEGDGTKQAPFRSTHALEPLLERREEEISHEHGEVSPLELLFAGGEYEGLDFNGAKEYSVYGDLNPSTWKAEREPSNPTRFVGRPQGLLLNGSTEMSFQQVSFRGEPGAGGSVYGVRMIDKAHATFADVHASAGNAPAGANGAPGAGGNPGAKGVAGAEGHTPGQEFCVKLPSPGCNAGYLGGNAAGGEGEPTPNTPRAPSAGPAGSAATATPTCTRTGSTSKNARSRNARSHRPTAPPEAPAAPPRPALAGAVAKGAPAGARPPTARATAGPAAPAAPAWAARQGTCRPNTSSIRRPRGIPATPAPARSAAPVAGVAGVAPAVAVRASALKSRCRKRAPATAAVAVVAVAARATAGRAAAGAVGRSASSSPAKRRRRSATPATSKPPTAAAAATAARAAPVARAVRAAKVGSTSRARSAPAVTPAPAAPAVVAAGAAAGGRPELRDLRSQPLWREGDDLRRHRAGERATGRRRLFAQRGRHAGRDRVRGQERDLHRLQGELIGPQPAGGGEDLRRHGDHHDRMPECLHRHGRARDSRKTQSETRKGRLARERIRDTDRGGRLQAEGKACGRAAHPLEQAGSSPGEASRDAGGDARRGAEAG